MYTAKTGIQLKPLTYIEILKSIIDRNFIVSLVNVNKICSYFRFGTDLVDKAISTFFYVDVNL